MNTSSQTALFNILKHDSDFQSLSAGQTIFEEGQPAEAMYFLQKGEVDILSQGEVINTLGPGEIFGEMALIDTKIRSASAIAKTDCQLVPVDEKRFVALVQQHPYFSLNVMRVLAERLRRRTAC